MLLGIGAIVGIVITAGVILAVTSGGGDSGPEFKASTSVDLTAGETKIERTNAAFDAPPPIPADVQEQILGVVGRYVDEGVVGALRTGKADEAALAEIFDAAAVARLAGTDRPVVLDEGLPKAVGKVSVTTPAVAMTALANPDGTLLFVSANVEFTITAQAEKGTVHITRIGSFVLAPDPTTGWKITGWTLARRSLGSGRDPADHGAHPFDDGGEVMKHPLMRLLLVIPVCGALVAGLLTAGWLALGTPRRRRAPCGSKSRTWVTPSSAARPGSRSSSSRWGTTVEPTPTRASVTRSTSWA